MKLMGKDHDLLLVSHVLKLYDLPAESAAAFSLASDDMPDDDLLEPGEMADMLAYAGLPVLLLDERTPALTARASQWADIGALVLVRLMCPDLCPEPLWHIVTNGHPGYFATLCLVERPRPPFLGGAVQDHRIGGVVLVPCRCPAWRGRWDDLLPD